MSAASLADAKSFYQSIAAVCVGLGLEAYVPHLMGTDPVANADVQSREVYDRDMAAIEGSDLVIAYVGEASLGVGAEIERATACGIDVVLLHEADRDVSRLIQGCPSVRATIGFASREEGLCALSQAVRSWKRERYMHD